MRLRLMASAALAATVAAVTVGCGASADLSRLYDFGAPVDATPPPADQVAEMAPMETGMLTYTAASVTTG
jgi:hypothetical protein